MTAPVPSPPTAPDRPFPDGGSAAVPVADGPRRRGALVAVLAVLLVVATGALVWSFWLTGQWHDRARRAEAEYERIAAQLGVSERDNQSLLGKQQELAGEKARIEDERVALEQQKAALETQSTELADQVELVAQIASFYSECSAGYSRVIAALDAGQVTQSTVDTLRAANTACTKADELAGELDR